MTEKIDTAPPPSRAYLGRSRRKSVILALMLLALAASVLTDVALGPVGLGLAEVLQGIFALAGTDLRTIVVVRDIRLPGALMAAVAGGALALAGAIMQTILNNPLASPFTLGISAAAGFGASLALAFGVAVLPLAAYIVPANAFVMAMLTAFLIHLLCLRREASAESIVLFGIALVFTFNAALALVQYFASERAVSAIVFWTLGSLTRATWESLGITAGVLLISAPLLARRVWALTAIRLGEEKAASFGIRVPRLRLQALVLVSLLASFPVAFIGTIGFVGIVGPHIARMLIGEDQRFFLSAATLSGALLLSLSSIVSKSLIPGTIFPVGIVTALVGVPFFLALVLSKRRLKW